MKLLQKGYKSGKATIIFDKNCPICSSVVKWIGENESMNSFEMVPCQSESMTSRFSVIAQDECMNAMHLVLPDGRVMVGDQALPEIMMRLRRYHFVATLLKLPGASILSRIAYRWFAGHRYKIAGIIAHMTGRKRHIT
jgi:predicted DCC family thiol-disulfide oxidoreductase YuxK